jgi:hypothetical protein
VGEKKKKKKPGMSGSIGTAETGCSVTAHLSDDTASPFPSPFADE